jgi:ribosome biogenesis GTPase
LIGSIIKIHSDFYYVKTDTAVFECKIREKLKKTKTSVLVGDKVVLEEINLESGQAVISAIRNRKNYISRPSIANIDQLIVTASLDQPAFSFMQLDRYLINANIHNISAIICINKSDLPDQKGLKEQIVSVYAPFGYKVIFTSAITGLGIEEFKTALALKRSVMTGISGVGKSSLLNTVDLKLNIRTESVSNKSSRGTHTTRHVELLEIKLENDQSAQIADTPGFSHLKFDTIMPEKIKEFFAEIYDLSQACHYADCLHIKEDGCNVLSNIDKIASSRYESYKIFVEEAQEYKKKLFSTGHKQEKNIKNLDTKDNEKVDIVKLGTKSREASRKMLKQKLGNISSLDDAYYNNEEN